MPREPSLGDEGYGKIESSSGKWLDSPAPPPGRFCGDNRGAAPEFTTGRENEAKTKATKFSHTDRSADLFLFLSLARQSRVPATARATKQEGPAMQAARHLKNLPKSIKNQLKSSPK